MRRIEIHLTPEQIKEERRGPAILRSIMWAYDAYDMVRIHPEGKNNMIAYYSDTKTAMEFVIGCIWRPNESRYSYHS